MTKNKKNKKSSLNNDTNISSELSEEDLKNLELLSIQKFALLLGVYSDFIFYNATLESTDLIVNKANKTAEERQELTIKIDREVIEATEILMFSRALLMHIAFTRYEIVYNKKLNGNFPYSLEPNESVNTAIKLKFLGDVYALHGAYGIFERDGNSVFGV